MSHYCATSHYKSPAISKAANIFAAIKVTRAQLRLGAKNFNLKKSTVISRGGIRMVFTYVCPSNSSPFTSSRTNRICTRVLHLRTVSPQTHLCASPVSARVLILSPQCTCTEVIAHLKPHCIYR